KSDASGRREQAKPVKTAADLIAEDKAAEQEAGTKGKAEGPAASKDSAGSNAGKGSTATATRPVARKTTEVTETRGRAAMTAAGNGVKRARNLLATIVWLAAVVCAVILALGALFTALSQTNERNEIVQWVLARGEDLVGPFGDLFKLETA